jgi:hypothetical protein
VPVLNDTIGVIDQSLVLDLISIVDKCKSDKDREISEAAYEIDDTIIFNKSVHKDKLKEREQKEHTLKRTE